MRTCTLVHTCMHMPHVHTGMQPCPMYTYPQTYLGTHTYIPIHTHTFPVVHTHSYTPCTHSHTHVPYSHSYTHSHTCANMSILMQHAYTTHTHSYTQCTYPYTCILTSPIHTHACSCTNMHAHMYTNTQTLTFTDACSVSGLSYMLTHLLL